MNTHEVAQQAVNALNGTDLGRRILVVNERPPEDNRPIGGRTGISGIPQTGQSP